MVDLQENMTHWSKETKSSRHYECSPAVASLYVEGYGNFVLSRAVTHTNCVCQAYYSESKPARPKLRGRQARRQQHGLGLVGEAQARNRGGKVGEDKDFGAEVIADQEAAAEWW